MSTAELKSHLHQMVEKIEDERLLQAILSLLKESQNSEESSRWNSLTEEQKKEVLAAFDESEDEANLIDDEDVWKEIK